MLQKDNFWSLFEKCMPPSCTCRLGRCWRGVGDGVLLLLRSLPVALVRCALLAILRLSECLLPVRVPWQLLPPCAFRSSCWSTTCCASCCFFLAVGAYLLLVVPNAESGSCRPVVSVRVVGFMSCLKPCGLMLVEESCRIEGSGFDCSRRSTAAELHRPMIVHEQKCMSSHP
jgi:hypothetical protein